MDPGENCRGMEDSPPGHLRANYEGFLTRDFMTYLHIKYDHRNGTNIERSRKSMFWSIEISGEVLSKLKSRGFREPSLSTNVFLLFISHYPII